MKKRQKLKFQKGRTTEISGWKNTYDLDEDRIPTITELIDPHNFFINSEKEIEKERKKHFSVSKAMNRNSNIETRNKLWFEKLQNLREKSSFQGLKENTIEYDQKENNQNNYKCLQGLLLQKPQLKYPLKNGQKNFSIKKDTIAMLMLIKKERQKKLKIRFATKSKKKKREAFLAEQEMQKKEKEMKNENYFPKSIPFKINKTMSQYFKKNEKKKAISNNGELFFL